MKISMSWYTMIRDLEIYEKTGNKDFLEIAKHGYQKYKDHGGRKTVAELEGVGL